MTLTTNALEVAAPAQTIYALASDTARWPELLPHYRFVRVLASEGNVRTVEMGAWRDWIPIRWVARQSNDPARPHITFHHLAGWTRGMDVEWRFEPTASGTLVTIEHRLAFRFPVASAWLGEHVVGDFFVHDVAAKTLRRIKELAEANA